MQGSRNAVSTLSINTGEEEERSSDANSSEGTAMDTTENAKKSDDLDAAGSYVPSTMKMVIHHSCTKMYNEEYNIPDPQYLRWMELYHPSTSAKCY